MQDIQTASPNVSNQPSASTPHIFQYTLPDMTVGAFFDNRISKQAKHLSLLNEIQLLQTRLAAHNSSVIELFCLLVENAPGVIPCEWTAVADVIATEKRFWVYPTTTVGQFEEGCVTDVFMPYLNRKQLTAEWARLLEHARRVHECQTSGRTHSYDY